MQSYLLVSHPANNMIPIPNGADGLAQARRGIGLKRCHALFAFSRSSKSRMLLRLSAKLGALPKIIPDIAV